MVSPMFAQTVLFQKKKKCLAHFKYIIHYLFKYKVSAKSTYLLHNQCLIKFTAEAISNINYLGKPGKIRKTEKI